MNLTIGADSVSQNDIDPDTALDLRVEDLNWQEKQSTSLCDRFQIHMFDKRFEQAEQEVIKREQENRTAVFEDVLSGEENINYENEQIFETLMGAEMETVIKADYKVSETNYFDLWPFIYIFGGIAAAGIIFQLIGHRRKKK